MKLLLSLSVVILSTTAMASTHRVFTCTSNGDSGGLIFTYDTKGETTEGTQPGYCKLTDASRYFCWVQDTQTAITSDGNLAIQFVQNLGSGAYLIHQLNVPRNAKNLSSFNGKLRLLSRSAKSLEKPLTSQNADDLTCVASQVHFKN